MAPRGSSEDPKVTALRESRCLNPHPEQVTDEAFVSGEFFDARDAVQVKYEMVRRVSVDGAPVTATAAAVVERYGECLPGWPVRGVYRADGERLRGGLVGGGTVPMIAPGSLWPAARRADGGMCVGSVPCPG